MRLDTDELVAMAKWVTRMLSQDKSLNELAACEEHSDPWTCAPWSMEEPLDGGLEALWNGSHWWLAELCADVERVATLLEVASWRWVTPPTPLSWGQSSDGYCFFVDGIVRCAVHAPDDSRAPSGRSPSWTPGASAVSWLSFICTVQTVSFLPSPQAGGGLINTKAVFLVFWQGITAHTLNKNVSAL